MSIENGYTPNPPGENFPRKKAEEKKSNLKKIIGAALALGTAGYLASRENPPKIPANKDTPTEIKSGSKSELNKKILPYSIQEPDFEEQPMDFTPDDHEPSRLVRPLPSDSTDLESEKQIVFPPELQEQADELHRLCYEFYNEDAETLIDPLRPPVVKLIQQHYEQFVEDAKKYPDMDSFDEGTFCGDREKYAKRFQELVNTLINSDQSDYAKSWGLMNLEQTSSGFYSGHVDSHLTYELAAKSHNHNEEKEYYHTFLDYALKEGGDFSLEQYEHIAFRLYASLKQDRLKNYSFYTDEERESVSRFIKPFLHDNALAHQSGQYHDLDTLIQNPPGEDSSNEDVQHWEENLGYSLYELIKSLKNNQEDDLSIDPREYGCPYTLEELQAMYDDLHREE